MRYPRPRPLFGPLRRLRSRRFGRVFPANVFASALCMIPAVRSKPPPTCRSRHSTLAGPAMSALDGEPAAIFASARGHRPVWFRKSTHSIEFTQHIVGVVLLSRQESRMFAVRVNQRSDMPLSAGSKQSIAAVASKNPTGRSWPIPVCC